MATFLDLTRVAIHAQMAGGEELVHSLYVLPTRSASGDWTGNELQGIANRVRDEWANAVTVGANGLRGILASSLVYDSVTVYGLSGNGTAGAQAAAAFPSGTAGAGTAVLPNEVAMAVSLGTARAGRSGRGRVYLGGIAQGAVGPEGRFQTANITIAANALSGFATALKSTARPNPGTLCVFSRVKEELNPVTSVRVGDVPDVQRRRRSKLRESYVVGPAVS